MMPIVVVEPIAEPLTLDECRQHLRVVPYEADDSDSDSDGTHPDDWWIMNIGLPTARRHCENFTGLSLSTRTLEVALDRFPTVSTDGGVSINLEMGPVREIVSISVGEPTSDTDAVDFELDPDSYRLRTRRAWNQLSPVSAWPTTVESIEGIVIRYVAGYAISSEAGDEGPMLPPELRGAMCLVLGHLYEHREENIESALTSIPLNAEALMRPLRVRLGSA